MQIRLTLLFTLICFAAFGQVFQVNNTPFKFVGVKADSVLVVPSGVDTPMLSNPKWKEAVNGALFLRTSDSTLWAKVGQRWKNISSGGVDSVTTDVVDELEYFYYWKNGQSTLFYAKDFRVGILFGLAVTSLSPPYTFNVSFGHAQTPLGREIGGGVSVTLDPADPLPRYDLLYIPGTLPGNLGLIKGTPAQVPQIPAQPANTVVLSTFYVADGNATPTPPTVDSGAYRQLVRLNDSTAIFQRANGTQDTLVLAGSGIDTTSLSNRINLKLNISDTASIVANYLRNAYRLSGVDSIYFTRGNGTTFALRDSVGWSLTGNAGTNANNNFIGTTDDVDFSIRRNNVRVGFFGSNNRLFFGQNAGNSVAGGPNVFIGLNAGNSATNVNNSHFLGQFAGQNATNAGSSNFFGSFAGQNATNAGGSNFIGRNAGREATAANQSNFLGNNAGDGATNANNSNFIGINAGFQATNASNSTLIGRNAGRTFTGNNIGSNNIIIGTNISLPDATSNAINIGGVLFGTGTHSNVSGNPSIVPATNGRIGIGVVTPDASSILDITSTNRGVLLPRMTATQRDAITSPATGLQVYNTTTNQIEFFNGTTWVPANANLSWSLTGNAGTNADTNFIGTTDDVDFSIRRNNVRVGYFGSDNRFWFGQNAGQNATNASNSNFFGINAGRDATNASHSNFFGRFAGQNSSSAAGSNFFGDQAGKDAASANGSNFFGGFAGANATNANNSNFLGYLSGTDATNAQRSNFLGRSAGQGATNASFSNFFGQSAGQNATNASNSNFFGINAGRDATNASHSNFFGRFAGQNSSSAAGSNFFGDQAGKDAASANGSNFFGGFAGANATNANNSNFLGYLSGTDATNAQRSNFLGRSAGQGATNASFSNFFGQNAGQNATNASNSNLFGRNVGRTFDGNNIGSNNIIIGTNISLPNATSNAINIGGVLFGTGTHSIVSGDPSIVPTSNGRIGIGVVTPAAVLDLRASTTLEAVINLKVGPAPTNPNDGDIWLESNTDTGLKIRINGVTRTIQIN